MQLFVMRHGQASSYASNDASRELTEQGFLEAKVMAKWANEQGISFDKVYASPYVRAQQTANTLVAQLTQLSPITTLDFITPSDSASMVHDYIDGICQVEKLTSLLIVSHMPLVSYLTAELTIDKNAPIFPTAGIAQIDYDLRKMKGELVAFVSPNDIC